ncbi:MAG: hypothetical protein CXZ00_02155 [Acidobacteria bacterium]|nr:MAG: hypothetical protein CXZ00_02155 [Acidobacteriota bacterium]
MEGPPERSTHCSRALFGTESEFDSDARWRTITLKFMMDKTAFRSNILSGRPRYRSALAASAHIL